MKEIVEAIVYILLPMYLTHMIYSIADRKGKFTLSVCRRFERIAKHKYLFELGTTFGFVIVFGIVSIVCGIPVRVFYIVSGVVAGLINGFSAVLMNKS